VSVLEFFVVVAETVQIVVGAVVDINKKVLEVVAETDQTVAEIVQMVVFVVVVLQVESVSVVAIFASVATVFWITVVFQPQFRCFTS